MAEKILLVEDEEKLARMVELELRYEGYQVDKSFDGRSGLERALSGEFFRLELRDDTRLRRDLWDRCGDDTLRGLFLGQLRREYDGADPRRQKEIEQAVRFGLAAMDNTIDS